LAAGLGWEVEGHSLRLQVADAAAWEEVLASGACTALAEWFRQEYGLTMVVTCHCSQQSPVVAEEGPAQVPAAVPELADELVPQAEQRRKGRRRGRQSRGEQNGLQGAAVTVAELEEGMRAAVVEGEIIGCSQRTLKDGRRLLTYYLTDYTDTIAVKHFAEAEETPLAENSWVRVQGSVRFDERDRELALFAQAWQEKEPPRRRDQAPEKRVELHAHTVMSALDGVVRVRELVKRAAAWGHPAVAITDHGVVQAFPEAFAGAGKEGIKVIYGMEGYLVDEPRQRRPYHIILLAATQQGLQNLYRLVSKSHLEHFYRTPRILRRDLVELREGLILGTACEAGELITAYLEGRPREELARIARFYDYLEIQPLGNNEFLVREGRLQSLEDLQEMNRAIVALGDEVGRPVVATGDVHFLDPHHEVYRKVLQAGKGFEDAEAQAPLYLRTTEEMLAEFAYLGEERAYQVVVANSRAIAQRIERLRPVPEGTYFPTIEGAGDEVEALAWEGARRIYGDPLPPLVEQRLRRELESIIGNGFAVLYLIAHKLVKKSNDDGYLVGSRGSVGSSLVAFLAGITEVNPLPPHYRCPQCCATQFAPAGPADCGADLPPRDCPACGTGMVRDGFDIPFETFLGFEGEKKPDIDLNFSGEYQARAHQYVEEVFGREHVFRAGTISTLADASAVGFVRAYEEKYGLQLRKGEVARLAAGITGVRRTTGQHPGGLIVVPRETDIHLFTPLNHPANRADSGVVTTHFDYHSIDDQLVKLDILGHDDPTMIRMLEQLTGVSAVGVPLDEPATMALFSSVEPLGVSPEVLRAAVGTYGVPEFNTRFVRQMLEATRPRTFSELVRISGLSHGTDVWSNNAQDLIASGCATLNEVIATRDDIMTYLIGQGVEKSRAFDIMERIRKGKGLTPEEQELLLAHEVPSWYVQSCQKIRYMFPKAHAVAYVMMAFRIAYFKVYHPREFYAAYFSVRAADFDAEVILAGYDAVRQRLEAIEAQGLRAQAKDRKLIPVLEVALEMYARGLRFLPADLDASLADHFRVCPEGLVLPFSAYANVGEKAAESIVAARRAGPFSSIEDLQRRAGVSRTVIEALSRSGCLQGLPESSQLSLFA
ncbi:MAG: PolC-type DNA polymerase III, partial [Syntrophomonadaceae bacterium]|nr:PolC-type DNA polymerase III [Syntrophomonadaceae bacterium]